LVRYIGQAVDAKGPEFYLSCMKTKEGKLYYTKFSEHVPKDVGELSSYEGPDANLLMEERFPVYATGFSHLSSWADQTLFKRT